VTRKSFTVSIMTGHDKATGEFSAMPTGTNFSAVQGDHFFADKGTVTIHGKGTTGSISATFANTDDQQLKITGHWTCTS